VDDAKAALKVAQNKVLPAEAQPAATPPTAAPPAGGKIDAAVEAQKNLKSAQDNLVSWRECASQAERYVANLRVNLVKLRLWEKRISAGLLGGMGAGSVEQLGAALAIAWPVTPNMEAEVAPGFRWLGGVGINRSPRPNDWLGTIRFRALFGEVAPLHIGTTFAVGGIGDRGTTAFLIPEVGAIFRLRSEEVCDSAGALKEAVWPWCLGVSIEPMIPLTSNSSGFTVMLNVTVEVGWASGRMLSLEQFADWSGSTVVNAKNTLGCNAAEKDTKGSAGAVSPGKN